MPQTLSISLTCLAVYVLVGILPGAIHGIRQMIMGLAYFSFSIMFLLFVWRTYHSFLYIAGTVAGLFIFMYVVQIPVAIIKRLSQDHKL